MGSGTQMLIMNTKLFALALLATLAASKEIMREKRSPIGVAEGAALAGAVGLGGLGGYSVYDWISRGSEAGARTELGLGPLELVCSHGIGPLHEGTRFSIGGGAPV